MNVWWQAIAQLSATAKYAAEFGEEALTLVLDCIGYAVTETKASTAHVLQTMFCKPCFAIISFCLAQFHRRTDVCDIGATGCRTIRNLVQVTYCSTHNVKQHRFSRYVVFVFICINYSFR
jgi:hypothetical protein